MSSSKGARSVILIACASGLVLYYARRRYLLKSKTDTPKDGTKAKKIPTMNREFMKQLLKLMRISFPSAWSKEFGLLVVHTMSLVSRTFLSIYVAKLDGRIVKSIVEGSVPKFIELSVKWLLLAVPATFVNSLIRFLESKLALAIRTRLVNHAYSLYFSDQIYYRVSNLDGRLMNPDHSLTEDLQAFSSAVAHIYSQISKPTLDIVLMAAALTRIAKQRGDLSHYPGIIGFGTLFVTAAILKVLSPPFGKLVAEEARRNGFLRYLHSRIITNSEEIAFYAGHLVRKSEERWMVNGWIAGIINSVIISFPDRTSSFTKEFCCTSCSNGSTF